MNTILAVQVFDPKQGWVDLNQRILRPGMTAEERGQVVVEIMKIYDGWQVSDKFKDQHIRFNTREC